MGNQTWVYSKSANGDRVMRRPIFWMIRCLALVHYAWGLALILLASWIVTSAFLILPHMSTGNIWIGLPTFLMLAASHAAPLGVLGMWIVILGHRTWTGHAGLRTALITTHGLLLLPGLLAAALGVFTMRAAARSAAQGGGLLSPVAVIPLAIGVPVVTLALGSILLALTAVPKQRNSKI